MKKYKYILIAITTFLAGIFGYCAYLFLTPVRVSEVRYTIPLYKIEKNPEQYLSNKVLLQEKLIVEKNYEGTFDYYIQGGRKNCGTFTAHNIKYSNCDSASLKFVGLVEKREAEMIQEIAERNSQKHSIPRRGIYGAAVSIEGYVKISNSPRDFISIEITDIKQLSPVELISEE